MKHVKHLYIHIPFCTHICAYCDFVKSRYHEGLADHVIDRLIEDINECESETLKTCYIGGGTPSALSLNQLERLCQTIHHKWPNIEEYTVEINPEDMDLLKMQCLKNYGVNRLSMGVQATQVRLLKIITRHHLFEDVLKVTQWAHECGIDNISYDLMYGLPTQSIEEFEESIHKVLTLSPSHLSLYALTIEPNTAFGRQKVQPVDNELEGAMYQCAINTLTKAGYEHYEVSSFAKSSKHRSAHNLSYWHYSDFLGLGPGAASKVGSRRWTNTRNIHHYTQKQSLIYEDIALSVQDQVIEILMMGLRVNEKVSFERLESYVSNIKEILQPVLDSSIKQGWIVVDEEGLLSTPLGRLFLHDLVVNMMEVIELDTI
jgi:oxygen-independent coproporphyrinogen III oxidase